MKRTLLFIVYVLLSLSGYAQTVACDQCRLGEVQQADW